MMMDDDDDAMTMMICGTMAWRGRFKRVPMSFSLPACPIPVSYRHTRLPLSN